MNTEWITRAIWLGGTLEIASIPAMNGLLVARIYWLCSMRDPIRSELHIDIESALEDLEQKLLEDCAEEMRKDGKV